MYDLLLYFIGMFYQVYYLSKKDQLHHYPAFLVFAMPILIVCYTSLYLGRFSFVLQFVIAMSILSILLLVGSHLLFFRKHLLSYIHTRYFYIGSILIYLYVFTSLNGKNIGTSAFTNPWLSAICIISMCTLMLLILNSIGKTSSIQWRQLCSMKLSFATLISNFSIYQFTIHTSPFPDSRMSILLYGIPLLVPYFIRVWKTIRNANYQPVFSTCFGIMILLFLILSTTDIIFPNIPLLYYYDIFIHRGIQIGLYAMVLLLLPCMKKLPYPILYHMLAFCISLLCLLLFW